MVSLTIFIAILFASCNSQNYNYYVSTSGSDSNGDGSQSKPWATIQNAQKNVAKLITTLNKNSYSGNITINVESGIYTGPLTFTPTDSFNGFTKNNYVIYKSMSPSKPAYIYGAVNITTSWTKSTKNGLNLYTTNIKSMTINKDKIHNLFINNPSSDPESTRVGMSKSKLLIYDSISTSNKQIMTNDKTIPNIAAIMATNYSMNLMVLVYEHWTSSYHYVKTIDCTSSSGKITLTLATCPTQWVGDAASGKRFYLLNNMELLTMNAQFYYNVSTMDLYLLTNQTITTQTVLLPQDVEIVTLKGASSSSKVEKMRFEGLHLKYSASDFSACLSGTCMDQSVAFLKTATLHTMNVDDVVFDGVNVSETGGYGVWLDEGSYNSKFINGRVHNLGAGGIRVGVNAGGAPAVATIAMNVEVSNNYIEDGGYVFEAGCGILAQSFAYSNITNNRINMFKYTGISTGWTWSYETTSVSNNIIARNHISNIGQYILSDMGCIYTLGAQANCLYDNNICHDVYSYNYGGWGTYTDQASRWLLWTNNIVYKTKCAGHHQHFGLDNIFLNNIYAYNELDEGQHDGVFRSSQHDGGGSKCNYETDQGACSSFTMITNILYTNNTWGYDILGDSSHTYWKNMTTDGNLYYSVKQKANITFPDKYTIKQWMAEGKDPQNALADPMFVDPENYNFNLQLGSPAIALGFHQIDTTNVGPNW